MTDKGYRRLLIAVMAIALVAAVWLAVQRVQVESEFRQVEIAVAYDELLFLAGERDPGAVMSELREYGVTAVFFREQTLNEAARSGKFKLLSDIELREEPGFAETGIKPSPNYRYLLTRDKQVFNHLRRQLEMKLGQLQTYLVDGGPYVIAAPIPAAYLDSIGIGFPAWELEQVEEAGLNVIPQVRSWPGATPAGLAALAESLGEVPNVTAVAFNDPYLPGHPGLIEALAGELEPLGVPVTEIEFHSQAGVSRVGGLLPQRQVMLHAIGADEMPGYTPGQTADRYVLAATERNARVLLVRFFLNPQDDKDIWTVNTAYLQNISDGLKAAGLTLGAPAAPAPWQPPWELVALVGLGVIAGGLMLWEKLQLDRLSRLGRLLAGSAVLGWLGLLLVFDLNQAAKLMALAGVIIFPILAVVTVVPERGGSVGRSLLLFAQATGISLVGAAFMVGLLSDTGFIIKLDQFAGVKLAHAVPLLLVVLYFAFRPRDGTGWLTGLRRFLDRPILMKYAAVAAVAAVVGAVYLMRTGNEPTMLVSGLEMKLRTVLEQVLVVRPRTKEFLLGHPWLLLLLFTGYLDARYLPLVALGVIGQISLVNTFAHLHTPLLVSLFRAFNGVWLGVIIGLALIAAWFFAERWQKQWSVVGGRSSEAGEAPDEPGLEQSTVVGSSRSETAEVTVTPPQKKEWSIIDVGDRS